MFVRLERIGILVDFTFAKCVREDSHKITKIDIDKKDF